MPKSANKQIFLSRFSLHEPADELHPGSRKEDLFDFTVKREAFTALIPEARTIIKKHGADLRVWQTTIAGTNTGQLVAQTEYESNAAQGAAADSISADPDVLALQQKAAPLGTLVNVMLATEPE